MFGLFKLIDAHRIPSSLQLVPVGVEGIESDFNFTFQSCVTGLRFKNSILYFHEFTYHLEELTEKELKELQLLRLLNRRLETATTALENLFQLTPAKSDQVKRLIELTPETFLGEFQMDLDEQ